MKIANGGQTETLSGKISEVKVFSEIVNSASLWITTTRNEESLTFLSLSEAIELRDEINRAIKLMVGL